jgi:hypothetical protein
MIITVSQVIQQLGQSLNLTLDDIRRIKEIYAKIDIEALKEEARKRIRVVPWEPGQRAATGVLFEDVYPHLKEGYKAYSIYIDGNLVYFQYEAPQGGWMKTQEEMEKAAASQVENIVDDLVSAKILERILGEL